MVKINHLMKSAVALVFIFSLAPSIYAAQGETQIGRYMSVRNKPTEAQKNLMLQTVQTRFPAEITTVGQAIDHLLKNSGYTLSVVNAPPSVKKLLGFNLPIVDRDFGPMTLQAGLQTLAGDSFELKIDRMNREVTFIPKFGKK